MIQKHVFWFFWERKTSMYCSMSRLWRAFGLWPLTFSFPFLPLSFSTDSLPAAIGLLFMLFIRSLFSTLMSVSEPQISLDKSKSMEQNVQTGFHRNTHTSNTLCVDAHWSDFRRWQIRKAWEKSFFLQRNVQKHRTLWISLQWRLKHYKGNSTERERERERERVERESERKREREREREERERERE